MKKLLTSTGFLCFCLTMAVLAGALLQAAPLQVLDGRIYDQAVKLRRRPSAASPVALVAIDAASLQELGSWPWPRTEIAAMVERLATGGAAAIGLYPLYTSEESNPGLAEIRRLRQAFSAAPAAGGSAGEIAAALADSAGRLDGDARLAAAADRAGNLVLPLRFTLGLPPAGTSAELPPPLKENSLVPWRPHRDWLLTLSEFRNPLEEGRGEELVAREVSRPGPALTKSARALGHINLLADPDGRLRRVPLGIDFAGRWFPSMALQLAALLRQVPPGGLELGGTDGGFAGVTLGRSLLPTDGHFRQLLDNDDAEAVQVHSFAAVASGAVPAGAFRGLPVLIGLTAPGETTLYRLSSGEEAAGVEIAARSLAGLLSPSHLARPWWAFALETLVLLYFGLFLTLVVPRLSLRGGLLILGIFLLTWYGVVGALLVSRGLWFQVGPATLLALLGLTLIASLRRRRGTTPGYEDLKLLGLSYQGQGLLDMAHDKFLQCPVADPSIRELLYSLALDFERKRMFNKAVAVYAHILKAGRFKDVKKRMAGLKAMDQTMVFGHKGGKDATLVLHGAASRPTMGRYEILRELGQGAMGTVYLGRDPKINREVAIKTLRYADVEPEQLEGVKARFFREAEAAGRLNHPNSVIIYDAGEEHDMAYLAMEFLDGVDLSRHCTRGQLLPFRQVLEIAAAVADALDYAHRHDLVHRDIKPANIMLLAGGEVKVTDFGIARVMSSSQTQTGVVLGTPSYMSPEQVAGKKVDGRSDLFSLGAVLYEMLSGEKPFKGENLAVLMYNIANGSCPPLSEVAPSLPPYCAPIVDRLLAKGITRRYRSAAQVAESLRACLTGGKR